MSTDIRRGVTLFELIISVAIISITFYVLISVFSLVAVNSSDSRDATLMFYLAQGKMEEYLAKSDSFLIPYTGSWIRFAKEDQSYPSPGKNEINYPGRFQGFSYKIFLSYANKEVDPIVSREAGGINDLIKLTVAVKSIKSDGNDYIRSVSTLLPSRLQK